MTEILISLEKMVRTRRNTIVLGLASGLLACQYQTDNMHNDVIDAVVCLDATNATPITLPGGSFTMGSDKFYPEEELVKDIYVAPFRIDPFEVTRARFNTFVEETGYITVAERHPDPSLHPDIPVNKNVPGGAVFSMVMGGNAAGTWRFMAGANWRNPDGLNPENDSDMAKPVTQITHEDARAFAKWAGGDLPTEAQWEYAARAGKHNADYEWGNVPPDEMEIPRANTWQGLFPLLNKADDGFYSVAPVGCFPANAFGLYDMTGNVWEWVKDSDQDRNSGLIKGGSYLCAENYCRRYRPAARHSQELNFSTNHIGFRVAYPTQPQQ